MVYAKKYGNWTTVGAVLKKLSVNVVPAFKAQLEEDGKLILKTLIDHIDAQDLPWTPLSERAISLKGGDQTIYVETGYLKNNLQVKRIKSVAKGITIFVGASAWTRTPEGIKLSDLMIWLEYGTDNSPPRPLIRLTWGEVEPILRNNWKTLLQDLIETGGK